MKAWRKKYRNVRSDQLFQKYNRRRLKPFWKMFMPELVDFITRRSLIIKRLRECGCIQEKKP